MKRCDEPHLIAGNRDVLSQRMVIRKLGRTSLTLDVRFDGADGTRVAFEQVLVCTSLDTHRAVYREVLGREFGIAMTAVQVAGLIEDRAKVEIEVTAVVG